MTAQAQAIAPNGAQRLNDDRLFRQQCYIDGGWVGTMKDGSPGVRRRASLMPSAKSNRTSTSVDVRSSPSIWIRPPSRPPGQLAVGGSS